MHTYIPTPSQQPNTNTTRNKTQNTTKKKNAFAPAPPCQNQTQQHNKHNQHTKQTTNPTTHLCNTHIYIKLNQDQKHNKKKKEKQPKEFNMQAHSHRYYPDTEPATKSSQDRLETRPMLIIIHF